MERLPFIFLCAAILALANSRTPYAAQSPTATTPRKVAITIDDLPGAWPQSPAGRLDILQRVNRAIPQILNAHHAPAIGFVNEGKLQVTGERDARVALLQMWIDAGLALGNHTYSHANVDEMPVERYEDDIIRGEAVTQPLLAAAGQTERYFRHPYLFTGPSMEARNEIESFLAKRDYRIAPVTVENADYEFTPIWHEALEKHDDGLASRVKQEYLAYTEHVFDFYQAESRELFGRDIAQVLLIHDNELNADALDTLLTILEHRGYKFVSLDEALTDPAYATPDRYVSKIGPVWLERWKIALGRQPDFEHDPDPPEWVRKMSADISRRASK